MGILTRIFSNWLKKGRWVLMLAVLISLALAAITFFEKKPKKYVAKIYGCTSLLNFQSLFDYFGPVVASMKNGEKEIAARYLNLKANDLKYLDAIILDHVNQVVEEADIRYEFTIVTEFTEDTIGSERIEMALTNFVKNNSLLITKCAEKNKAFNGDKSVIKDEIIRVDSILNSFNDKNTVYYESLRQRKVDLTLQLNKYIEEHEEFYDIKIFYGFDKTGQWVADESEWLKMLVYYLIASIGATFVFAIFRDKALLKDIKSALSKSGVI